MIKVTTLALIVFAGLLVIGVIASAKKDGGGSFFGPILRFLAAAFALAIALAIWHFGWDGAKEMVRHVYKSVSAWVSELLGN